MHQILVILAGKKKEKKKIPLQMQFLSIFYPGSAVQTMQKPLKPE
jgi:hypothetical protein